MAVAKDYSNDERVIGAFLTNYRVVDIMRDSGLSKNIVYRLKKDERFQVVIRERKDAILQAAVNKLQGYMLKNIDILQDIIESPDTTANVKVNAIQVALNQLRDWTTTVELVRRVEAVEALQKPSGTVSGTFPGETDENIR